MDEISEAENGKIVEGQRDIIDDEMDLLERRCLNQFVQNNWTSNYQIDVLGARVEGGRICWLNNYDKISRASNAGNESKMVRGKGESVREEPLKGDAGEGLIMSDLGGIGMNYLEIFSALEKESSDNSTEMQKLMGSLVNKDYSLISKSNILSSAKREARILITSNDESSNPDIPKFSYIDKFMNKLQLNTGKKDESDSESDDSDNGDSPKPKKSKKAKGKLLTI